MEKVQKIAFIAGVALLAVMVASRIPAIRSFVFNVPQGV